MRSLLLHRYLSWWAVTWSSGWWAGQALITVQHQWQLGDTGSPRVWGRRETLGVPLTLNTLRPLCFHKALWKLTVSKKQSQCIEYKTSKDSTRGNTHSCTVFIRTSEASTQVKLLTEVLGLDVCLTAKFSKKWIFLG